MKKMLIMLAMVLGLLVSNVCYAQSGKEAVRALQKLQARVEAGISYRDYPPVIGDAKFEVNLYVKSLSDKEKYLDNLAIKIRRCMDYHEIARSTWGIYFAELQQGFTRKGIIPIKDIQHLSNIFPEITNNVTGIRDKKFVSIAEVLGVIWKHAGKVLEEAQEELSK
jgi:hypothetical protein